MTFTLGFPLRHIHISTVLFFLSALSSNCSILWTRPGLLKFGENLVKQVYKFNPLPIRLSNIWSQMFTNYFICSTSIWVAVTCSKANMLLIHPYQDMIWSGQIPHITDAHKLMCSHFCVEDSVSSSSKNWGFHFEWNTFG